MGKRRQTNLEAFRAKGEDPDLFAFRHTSLWGTSDQDLVVGQFVRVRLPIKTRNPWARGILASIKKDSDRTSYLVVLRSGTKMWGIQVRSRRDIEGLKTMTPEPFFNAKIRFEFTL